MTQYKQDLKKQKKKPKKPVVFLYTNNELLVNKNYATCNIKNILKININIKTKNI